MADSGFFEGLQQLLENYDTSDRDLGRVMPDARMLAGKFFPASEERMRTWLETLEAIEFRFEAKTKGMSRKRFFKRNPIREEALLLGSAIREAKYELRRLESGRQWHAIDQQINAGS